MPVCKSCRRTPCQRVHFPKDTVRGLRASSSKAFSFARLHFISLDYTYGSRSKPQPKAKAGGKKTGCLKKGPAAKKPLRGGRKCFGYRLVCICCAISTSSSRFHSFSFIFWAKKKESRRCTNIKYHRNIFFRNM